MKKILVVEDNDNNRYLMRYVLSNHGFEVVEAASGEEGISLAAREKPDLVLMDIQLPGIDGLEATKLIRRSCGDLTIVALTAHVMMGDREKAMEAGCDGYIEKPVDPETFIAKLREFFDVKEEGTSG